MASMTHKEKDAIIAKLQAKIKEFESEQIKPAKKAEVIVDCKSLLESSLQAVPNGDQVNERRIKNLIQKAISKL
jgi:hypothetical protein